MQIDKTELLAGVPAKRLRDALRRMDNSEWSPSHLARELGLTKTDAERVLAALVAEGYIEVTKRPRGGFCSGPAAPRLMNVRFIKRIDRGKADALVAGLKERAGAINADDRYVQSVAELQVFGSYVDLSKADCGDVDVAYRRVVKSKYQNLNITDLSNLTREQFPQIRPRNFLIFLYLLEKVILQTLKGRSPYISLHPMAELVKIGVTGTTIFSTAAT